MKVFKNHLKVTLGNSPVTLVEFLTIIVQIEDVLNSPLLLPLSSDPNEMKVLIPVHFLKGHSITSIPEPNLTDLTETGYLVGEKHPK